MNGLHQLGDSWMFEFGQQVDFPFKILDFIRLVNFLLFIYFDSYFLPIFLFNSHSYNSIRSFAQLSENLIFFHLFLSLNGNNEVKDWWFASCRDLFLLLLRLYFFLLNFIYVVRLDMIFHHGIYELCIYSFGILLLFLQWALCSFVTGRSAICYSKQDLSRSGSFLSALR